TMAGSADIERPTPRAPLALAAACFAFGIWITGHLYRAPAMWGWCALALVVCALAAVLAASSRLAMLAALLSLASAGAFVRTWMPSSHVSLPPQEFLNSELVEVEGHVTSDGAMLPGGGPRERFDM